MNAPVTAFGLEVAGREPIAVDEVDLSTLTYDPDQQITLTRDENGLVTPWCRHTDGPTNTQQNTDGHGQNETDTDHRED